MNSFRNKLILISGGSSGIGYALAVEFAKLGANICILARREDLLTRAKENIQSQMTSSDQFVALISADITQREQLNSQIQDFIMKYGVPDLLINSAGVAHPGQFENLEPDIFDWMINVNYMGTVNMCKAVIPSMIANKSGCVVNISSVAGFLGVYGYTAYCGSKFAVKGFSDALRSEMKLHNIQVQVVFPPDTQTPQLDYENKFKPKITKELSSSGGILSASQVAEAIIKGIRKGKPVIIPGLESKLMYFLSNFLGRWMYSVMDLMVKSASKK
jgi:3-dehydrosphinganine reductase